MEKEKKEKKEKKPKSERGKKSSKGDDNKSSRSKKSKKDKKPKSDKKGDLEKGDAPVAHGDQTNMDIADMGEESKLNEKTMVNHSEFETTVVKTWEKKEIKKETKRERRPYKPVEPGPCCPCLRNRGRPFWICCFVTLLLIALIILIILQMMDVIDLGVVPCEWRDVQESAKYQLEYKLSYCGDGNYCEYIYDLNDGDQVIQENCDVDSRFQHRFFTGDYTYFQDVMNAIEERNGCTNQGCINKDVKSRACKLDESMNARGPSNCLSNHDCMGERYCGNTLLCMGESGC